MYDDPLCASFFSFLAFHFLVFFLFFFREHFLARNEHRHVSVNDLQSSTPEEYLDGRILADETGLGDGPLAVEGDGGLPAQPGIDDWRDLLLLLQRLLLVSAKASNTTFVGGWTMISPMSD